MSRPENDPFLDHEYDGIRELDNPMPGWWKATFLASVILSVVYLAAYQGLGQDLVAEEYAADVAGFEALQKKLAAQESIVTEDGLAAITRDLTALAEAKAKYGVVCAPCHGLRGEGTIGPNLTDEFWIHGDGSLMSIHAVVDAGVAEKGMPAWGRQLRPVEVRRMAAYIGSLRNKNEPGGKKPEGQRRSAL